MNNEPSCNIQHREFETCGMVFRPFFVDEHSDRKVIEGHAHCFDHAMVIMAGEADIVGRYKDGTPAFEAHVKAGEVFAVQKDITHQITPTAFPYQHFCVFASRLPSGRVAGENTHWRGSDA